MDEGSAEAFDVLGTLGVEEEFYVVDDAGRPTSGTDELVYEAEPPAVLDGRLDHELFKFVIETQTPTIEDVGRAADVHREVRDALVAHAEAHGYRVAAAGLHPLARWWEEEHAEKPRYASQLDRIQYPQHRNTTAGLHVHVGVDDPDKAVWIANELRWHLPLVLALSANSPFWCGRDTGLASARATVFEALPNTGMPTRFADFEAYRSFERLMIETGSIADRGELWYDVRPHTGLGTVEVRTPDAQADPADAMALVEFVHALVLDLAERYEDGESGRRVRRELLEENKWRAIRHGREASFVTPDGEAVALGDLVERECARLGVTGIRELHEAEGGAAAQRAVRAAEGDDALCRSLLL